VDHLAPEEIAGLSAFTVPSRAETSEGANQSQESSKNIERKKKYESSTNGNPEHDDYEREETRIDASGGRS
jgi:hypothetical protein